MNTNMNTNQYTILQLYNRMYKLVKKRHLDNTLEIIISDESGESSKDFYVPGYTVNEIIKLKRNHTAKTLILECDSEGSSNSMTVKNFLDALQHAIQIQNIGDYVVLCDKVPVCVVTIDNEVKLSIYSQHTIDSIQDEIDDYDWESL